MSRVGRISGLHSHVAPLDRLRRHRRSVQVKVLEYGVESDSFSLSNPIILRAELRDIYKHLPRGHYVVEMKGIEESWLPMGLSRVRWETNLRNSADALFFLAA